MAMNGRDMGDLISAALVDSGVAIEGDDMEAVWRIVGDKIIEYIVENADIAIPAASFNANGTGSSPIPEVPCTIA